MLNYLSNTPLARELLISQRLLGISDPGFLRSLTMLALDIYPHLTRQTQQRYLGMLAEEDALFERTIQKGLGALERRFKTGEPIGPAEIVRIEKDGGIPFDLLCRFFQQKKISFDITAYQEELIDYLQKAQITSD
jgi:alanyl-tRNA synthetase